MMRDMVAEIVLLRAALLAITALDLGKTAGGHDDFYSGPGRFFRAHEIARNALDNALPVPR